MSSKYARKKKANDEDTSEEGRRAKESKEARERERAERDSESPPPTKKSKKPKKRDASPQNGGDADDKEDGGVTSMSIAETNKLRASLGLAPLDLDDTPKVKDAEDETGDQIIVEDGMEFRHRKADNWGEKKRQETIKEKLETAKNKRKIYDKVLKETKGLGEASDDEDDANAWVERQRQMEEEKRRAEERARQFNEMDEEFGVSGLIEAQKAKKDKQKASGQKRPGGGRRDPDTAGLIVGHSKGVFVDGADQILVLEDKGVLDTGDEVLINPNLIDDERTKRNVELKKRKATYRPYDEQVDEFGQPIHSQLLAKYDEELEGVKREKFRLDNQGGFDLSKEEREAQLAKELEMAGKNVVSLEMAKFNLATDFYTHEEMIAFRKPKKIKKEKIRKRGKILKASDLQPQEEPREGGKGKDLGRRRREDAEDGEELDEAEFRNEKKVKDEEPMETDSADMGDEDAAAKSKWKKMTEGRVDVNRLRRLAEKDDSDEESEDDELGPANLAGVIVEDDAENELHSILAKARRVKQKEIKVEKDPDGVAKKVAEMISKHEVKMEVDEDGNEIGMPDEQIGKNTITFDATMEYCRNIGDIPTYGLAGNRLDAIDVSELGGQQDDQPTSSKAAQSEESIDGEGFSKWKRKQIDRELRRKKREGQGGWKGTDRLDSDDEMELERVKEEISGLKEEGEASDEGEYENVLGDEADVTKGVGAMLKLAAQKGYLNDPNARRAAGVNLDHLKNQSKTQIAAMSYDIEDKYMKKLDRLGTTGRGPIVPFTEKKEYKPDVVLEYVDKKGRQMEAKDAYRQLSYKFHGRNPGKKQTEKKINAREKKEKLKQVNSSDTPLGTLEKLRKKQEQLQTPYLVLSGSRSDQGTIKKE